MSIAPPSKKLVKKSQNNKIIASIHSYVQATIEIFSKA